MLWPKPTYMYGFTMPVPAHKTTTYMQELCDWSQPLSQMRIDWILADCKRSLKSTAPLSNQEISDWHSITGLAYLRAGSYKRAYDAFRNAEHYAPHDKDLKLCVASAMLHLGMPADALEVMANINDPDNVQQTYILCNSAEALADLGAFSDAKDVFAEALRIADHSDYRVLHLLAAQAAEIGAEREAIEFLARSEAVKRGIVLASQPALEFIEQLPDLWDILKQPGGESLYSVVMRAKSFGPSIAAMNVLPMPPMQHDKAKGAANGALEVYNEMSPLRIAANEIVMNEGDEHASS